VAPVLTTQLLGLALTRYLIRLPAVTALDPEQVVQALLPAVQATVQSARAH
jgi:hypothetical protein